MLKEVIATTVIALLALAGVPAIAQTGAARVVDGDTIDVTGVRVRLWGIDAPEARQICERLGASYACGLEASAHLRSVIGLATVVCEERAKDRYGRTVAVCRANGIDLGAAMVSDGWALAFTRYSADYTVQEQDARVAKRGVWGGSFVPPWEWRVERRRSSN